MKERKGKGRGEDTDKTTEIRAGSDPFQRLLGLMFKAHPWHGVLADGGEADDKIIAVMRDDAVYGDFTDISECPSALMDRLQHYFLTYKSAPGTTHHKVEITSVYGGREEARKVIRASYADYRAKYPELSSLWPKNL